MTEIFSVILTCYCLLLVAFLVGWVRIRRQVMPVKPDPSPGISIVIAARNEGKNIENLLRDLTAIAYPQDQFEVIIVNDHSQDETRKTIEEGMRHYPWMRQLELPEGHAGKKEALLMGIQAARFKIIATTDADCHFSKNWLYCISQYFGDDDCKMVVGAVKYVPGRSLFSRLQVSELISLAGSTAAAIGLGHPVMCNGANLAFRKTVFDEVGGYEGNMQIASGDDEFLMRKIVKRYPSGIRFLNYFEAAVSTLPQLSLRDFFYQRIRWAGKWKHNTDPVTRLLAFFIFISQVAFIGIGLQNMLQENSGLVLILLKLFLEGVYLFWVGRFLKCRFDVPAFLILQILYPLYTISIAALSFGHSFQWKNRNYK